MILPALYRDLGIPATVGRVVTVFGLGLASAAALGGRPADVVGYRAVLLYALAASAVQNLRDGTASDPDRSRASSPASSGPRE